jgi:hypothetical protein
LAQAQREEAKAELAKQQKLRADAEAKARLAQAEALASKEREHAIQNNSLILTSLKDKIELQHLKSRRLGGHDWYKDGKVWRCRNGCGITGGCQPVECPRNVQYDQPDWNNWRDAKIKEGKFDQHLKDLGFRTDLDPQNNRLKV